MINIGISVSSSYPEVSPQTAASWMVARAREARQAGLDTLFVGDHHATSSPYYQNNVMLARMLAEWGDKPFGALYLLPLWHPVLLAEQIASLSALAEGPFVMQCGLGDTRQGLAMGIDMRDRVARFTAVLRTLRALWRGDQVDEDRFWGLSKAQISPIPDSSVDVWVGATAPPAIARAARLAEGWLASPALTPNEAGADCGLYQNACHALDRQQGVTAIRRDILLAATGGAARERAAPYIAKGYRGIPEQALMIGSVEEVTASMRSLAAQGYSDVIVRNISADQSECLETIALLADVKANLVG